MPWERELEVLESSIRNLNAQYDAFLYGSSSKPPVEIRRRVNAMIRRLAGQEADTAADRFRFSTLQGRYNTLCERWDRLQQEKEAGKRPGVYGHFMPSSAMPSSAAQVFSREEPPNARTAASVEPDGDTAAAAAPDRVLYQKYIEAKKNLGEDVGGYDFARFAESLKSQREKLRGRFGSAEIEFDVAERDGKIRLVARPKAG